MFHTDKEGAAHPAHTFYLPIGLYQLSPAPHLLNVQHAVPADTQTSSRRSPDFIAVSSINKFVLTSHFYGLFFLLLKFVFTLYVLRVCYWVHTDLGLQAQFSWVYFCLTSYTVVPSTPWSLRLPLCCLYISLRVFVCSLFSCPYTEARL